jgi:hypothetical protein
MIVKDEKGGGGGHQHIRLEELKKTTRNLGQKSLCPSRDTNRASGNADARSNLLSNYTEYTRNSRGEGADENIRT